MAIQLEANYSKKLGLPGYSSHQYSVTIRTEVADLNQVSSESERLHALLQSSVDREIQKTGYLPQGQPEQAPVNRNNIVNNGPHNGNSNGNGYRQNQNGHRNGYGNSINNNRSNGHNDRQEQWECSQKQQDLILKIVHENGLDKHHVERLSQQLFGTSVRCLNKLQASGLIDELILQQEANRPQPAPGGRR